VDVLLGLRQVLPSDILVVDDGSTDGTAERVSEVGERVKGVFLLSHGENRGYGAAIRTGFEFALERGYAKVVTVDGDGQHLAEDVPKVLDALKDYDMACGSRYHPESRAFGEPPAHRRRANEILARLVTRLTGYDVTDSAAGLRAYRRSALVGMDLREDGYALPFEVWGKAARQDLKVCEVPITRVYVEAPSQGREEVEREYMDGIILRCRIVLLRSLGKAALRERASYLLWLALRSRRMRKDLRRP